MTTDQPTAAEVPACLPTVPTVPTEYGHGDAEDDECDADGDGPARVPQARRGHATARRVAEEAVAAAAASTRRPRRGALGANVNGLENGQRRMRIAKESCLFV